MRRRGKATDPLFHRLAFAPPAQPPPALPSSMLLSRPHTTTSISLHFPRLRRAPLLAATISHYAPFCRAATAIACQGSAARNVRVSIATAPLSSHFITLFVATLRLSRSLACSHSCRSLSAQGDAAIWGSAVAAIHLSAIVGHVGEWQVGRGRTGSVDALVHSAA